MGKLRDSLTGLKEVLVRVEERNKTAETRAEELNAEMLKVFQTGLEAGAQILYTYLVEKFKKAEDSYAHHLNDTLVQHSDEMVKRFIAGIAKGKKDLGQQFESWNAFVLKDVGGLKGDLDRVDEYVDDVGRQLAQKKSKWLQSDEYKLKIGAYESTLKQIKVSREVLKEALGKYQPCLNQSHLDALALTPHTTLKQIDDSSLLTGLKAIMANAQRFASTSASNRKDARDKAKLDNAVKLLANWVSKADDMEAQASADKQPANQERSNGKAELRKLYVKQGGHRIGESDKGVYDEDKHELAADIEWDKQRVREPLDLLQEKVVLEGEFKDPKRGKLLHDATLYKLNANMKSTTFKMQ